MAASPLAPQAKNSEYRRPVRAGKIYGYAASCFSGNARNMEKNGGKSARAAGKK
jgi:hypothetical protein